MKFGVREITDIVFKSTAASQKLGKLTSSAPYQPLLMLDSAKTSTLESSVATVYAQGGRGNPRLLAWDGDKVVTFKFEDALISPASFQALSGAGLTTGSQVKLHLTEKVTATAGSVSGGKVVISGLSGELTNVDVASAAVSNGTATVTYASTTEIFPVGSKVVVYGTSKDDLNNTISTVLTSTSASGVYTITFATEAANGTATVTSAVLSSIDATYIKVLSLDAGSEIQSVLVTDSTALKYSVKYANNTLTIDNIPGISDGSSVLVDFYLTQTGNTLEVSADKFAGYYYIEANTLFRGTDGKDYPAQFTIPRSKIQSNFTFTMASTGDPSAFEFMLDAFPATVAGGSKKVLFALDISGDTTDVI